jgi:NIMA (never in mitosis gene a)-related kinase
MVQGGDLDKLLKQLKQNGKTLDESLVLDWFVQLTNAVRYIHDRKILHRDLKTRNIFIKDNNIKLGDFGISRILAGTSDYATTFTGTPYYMSPEVLKHDRYNTKSDIWSLGAVLYELCTSEHAYDGSNLMAVMYKIVEDNSPKLPSTYSPSLRYIHARMMDKRPEFRPSAIEILQDPHIKQHMTTLSQKLALTLNKSDPSKEAEDIAKALNKQHKKVSSSDTADGAASLTPRQKMLDRKAKKADLEAKKLTEITAKKFEENQKRLQDQKSKKKVKVVPPWVQEHPDVFNDPSFSLTAASEGKSETLENSVMESCIDTSASNITNNETNYTAIDDIPEDPIVADQYYSQFDDFEMDISDSESKEDDCEAILYCINEALELPGTSHVIPDPSQVLILEEVPVEITVEGKIAQLKSNAIQIFGQEVFQQVYEYLRLARADEKKSNDESAVVAGLKNITNNIRDCFYVDQIVFLEKKQ